jgi:hypothetical protein
MLNSLYRADSLKTVTGELAKYILDLVAVQEIIWDYGRFRPAEDYKFFSETETLITLRDRIFRT